MKLRAVFTSLLLALSLAVSPASMAQQNKDKGLNKEQAVRKAQQQVKGRVLKVDQRNSKYRVKMLQKSGRVVNVDVDKKSGKVTPPPRKKDY